MQGSKVIKPDGETDLVELKAGQLQGDTLAPYLFIIALAYELRIAVMVKEEDLGL